MRASSKACSERWTRWSPPPAACRGSDGRVALLGHSMASDIVVRYAQTHPESLATIGVSLFSPGVTADSPRNLLVIDGALEPAMLTDEGYRIAGMAAGGPARQRVTYGDLRRRHRPAGRRWRDGVEHIGVLYSRDSLAEAVDWLDAAFERRGERLPRRARALARAPVPRARRPGPAALGPAARGGADAARHGPAVAPPAARGRGTGRADAADPVAAADRLPAHSARRLFGRAFRALWRCSRRLGLRLARFTGASRAPRPHAHGGSWHSPSWPWPPMPFWSSACRSTAT